MFPPFHECNCQFFYVHPHPLRHKLTRSCRTGTTVLPSLQSFHCHGGPPTSKSMWYLRNLFLFFLFQPLSYYMKCLIFSTFKCTKNESLFPINKCWLYKKFTSRLSRTYIVQLNGPISKCHSTRKCCHFIIPTVVTRVWYYWVVFLVSEKWWKTNPLKKTHPILYSSEGIK